MMRLVGLCRSELDSVRVCTIDNYYLDTDIVYKMGERTSIDSLHHSRSLMTLFRRASITKLLRKGRKRSYQHITNASYHT